MKLLIVNFHYYGYEKYTSGIYPVTPESFQSQIKAIAKDHTFISQNELSKHITENNYPEGNYCLLTFDDGLKQQMQAFDWLKMNGIPAVFYIPTKPLLESNVLDVHKLHFIRAKSQDTDLLQILKASSAYGFTANDHSRARDQYKYDDSLAREVKYQLNFKLSSKDKATFIENTFRKLFPDEESFSKNLYMSESELRLIAESGMLGSHGYAHVPLALIDTAEEDIRSSIAYLESLTDSQIISFSYPYGSKAAVDTKITEYFSDTNIKFALTMWRGTNDLTEATNPFQLLRIDTNDAPGGKKPITL